APSLRALELGRHSRVFVDKSVPAIFEEILRENEITSYELRLGSSYGPRKHVCQYKESDFAFLHRWMEREGIYYYFLHDGGEAKLVITDDKAKHDDAGPGHVPYRPGRAGGTTRSVRSWSREHRGVERGVRLGDYDYRKPALRLGQSRPGARNGFEEYVRFE